MSDSPEELQRQIHQLDNKLIEQEVSRLILKYGLELSDLMFQGKTPDSDKYARQIVAFCREHIVK